MFLEKIDMLSQIQITPKVRPKSHNPKEEEEAKPKFIPKVTIIHSDLKRWKNKLYMGGFRNKKTGKEYFHTATQTRTPQDAQAENRALSFHRDTQTVDIANNKTQSVREKGTQMVIHI